MRKSQIRKYMAMTLLFCMAFTAKARPTCREFRNLPVRQDSSIRDLVNKRIQLITKISVNQGIDTYYIRLMNSLYDGVNEVLDFETRVGDTIGLMRQAGLFRRFHMARKIDLSAFLEKESKKPVIGDRFSEAVKAVLFKFREISFNRYHAGSEIITQILITYYENMDQISVAFVSFGQNEKLKALSWDIIRKQNKIIGLLKAGTAP